MTVFSRLMASCLLAVFLAWSGAARADDGFAIDQTLGKADAPVTIIEYASLTCPHCAHFAETTLPQIKKDWIDTGKARLIYRDFPTGPVGPSLAASMVTHCSGPQRYFGVLDLLMRTQEKWIDARSPVDEIKRIVAVAGIGPDQVDACLKRQELMEAIQNRAELANRSLNIDSTPSFVINGQVYAGALSYDEMKGKLDEALRAAGK